MDSFYKLYYWSINPILRLLKLNPASFFLKKKKVPEQVSSNSSQVNYTHPTPSSSSLPPKKKTTNKQKKKPSHSAVFQNAPRGKKQKKKEWRATQPMN